MVTKPCYLLLPVAACALACSDAPTATEDDLLPYEYVVPPETGDGWTTASLADVGLAEERFVQLIDIIRTGTYANIHGIVVVKDHRLVFEEYFDGLAFRAAVGTRVVGNWKHFDRAQPHNLASATKSITSTILGIAIDKGFVSSVDTAVYDFFPEYSQFRRCSQGLDHASAHADDDVGSRLGRVDLHIWAKLQRHQCPVLASRPRQVHPRQAGRRPAR